ncbi:MAG: hypothetical protein IT373_24645 [Polyangiaceae bacterium]|nr:hypothetical protein [Polyangiaceae bacterium]
MPRIRARSWWAAGGALVLAACRPSAAPPAPSASAPATSSTPPASASAAQPGADEASRCRAHVAAATVEPPAPACRPSPVALVALESLVGRPSPRHPKPSARVELGTIPAAQRPQPAVFVGLGRRSFWRVLDAALPAELAAPVEAVLEAERRLREAAQAAARLERAAEDCAGAPDERCQCVTAAVAEHRATAEARRREQRALRERARAAVEDVVRSAGAAPSPAALTVLGELAWAESSDDAGLEAQPDLAPAREAFARAAAFAPPATALGWIARYDLGLLAREAGDDAAARAALAPLAALPAAPAEIGHGLDVELWLGELATSSAEALAHFERAASTSGTVEAEVVAGVASFSLMQRAYAAGELARAVAAGARLAAFTSGCEEERGDYRPELGAIAGRALDRLGPGVAAGARAAPLAIGADAFPDVALGVAEAALERGDVEAATHAWRALLDASPTSWLAPRALVALAAERRRAGDATAATALETELARSYGPGSPWAELHRARLARPGASSPPPPPALPARDPGVGELGERLRSLASELVSACAARTGAPAGAEVELTVAPAQDGLATVGARALGSAPAELASCARELGRSWLRGVPLAARATVSVLP